MTSIHNYKGFCEFLSQELSRAKRIKRPLSLIFADIDHFKLVNDTFGHLAGDCALKAVAICLKNVLREADYLARYGGEEFAIILPESNIEGAFLVAERLRERIKSQNIVYKGKTISLTMSFGVACMPSNQDLAIRFAYLLNSYILLDPDLRACMPRQNSWSMKWFCPYRQCFAT